MEPTSAWMSSSMCTAITYLELGMMGAYNQSRIAAAATDTQIRPLWGVLRMIW